MRTPKESFSASRFRMRSALSLILLFLVLYASPASASGYEWKATEGLQGWGLHNVHSVQQTGDSVIVSGLKDNLYFMLTTPKVLIHDSSFVKILLRTMSNGATITCMLLSHGRVVVSNDLHLRSGKTWKECFFDMRAEETKNVPIDAVTFGFKYPYSVEIKEISVMGPSASEFFVLQGLKPTSVNYIEPFTVYGYSVNILFYAAAVVSAFGIAVYYIINKNKGALTFMCIVLLSLYFVLDAREVYEELVIVETVYDDYLSASLAERRYLWSDDLIDFADLIRRTVDPKDKAVLFSEDDGNTLLAYLLYPMKIELRNTTINELGAVNIFYLGLDAVRLDGNKLIGNGNVIHEDGKGIEFDSQSFLYLAK